MKKSILTTIVSALVALPFCFAFAQEGEKGKGKGKGADGKGRPPGGPRFERPKFGDIDADGSGDVSKEEWIAYQVKMAKQRAERSFNFIAGEDGKITKEDFEKMAQRRGGPGSGRGGPGGKGRPDGGKGGKAEGGKGKGGKGEESGGGTKPKRPELEE